MSQTLQEVLGGLGFKVFLLGQGILSPGAASGASGLF